MAVARRRVPELMDDPALDYTQHLFALRGLANLNRWSQAAWPFVEPIRRLAADLGRPLRVLDVAAGGGDVPRRLLRCGLPAEFTGCDLSETALDVWRCHFLPAFRHDVVRDPLPGGYDLVMCSLFLHHLDEPDVIRVIANMKRAAGRMVVATDLVRGRLNLGLVTLGSRLLSRSPVVHFDAPASVRAAFTPAELRALAKAAGLDGATVRTGGPVPHGADLGAAVTGTISAYYAVSLRWDAVVVGAGPAGATAARELARRGRSVLLVDKATFPRPKVCGCCLNGSALATLERVGLGDLPARNRAVPLDRTRLFAGGRAAEVRLPVGVALSRSVFDVPRSSRRRWTPGRRFCPIARPDRGSARSTHRLAGRTPG